MAASLWIAAGLIGGLVLVLLLPWHVRFRGTTSPFELRVRLRPMGGLGPGIPIPIRRSSAHVARRKTGKPRKRRRKGGPPKGLRDLALGLLSACRPRKLQLSGRIGLSDPADTGVLWGQLTPFVYVLGAGGARHIDIAPEFSGPCFDLEGSGHLVIRPARLLRTALRFAWANRRTR